MRLRTVTAAERQRLCEELTLCEMITLGEAGVITRFHRGPGLRGVRSPDVHIWWPCRDSPAREPVSRRLRASGCMRRGGEGPLREKSSPSRSSVSTGKQAWSGEGRSQFCLTGLKLLGGVVPESAGPVETDWGGPGLSQALCPRREGGA